MDGGDGGAPVTRRPARRSPDMADRIINGAAEENASEAALRGQVQSGLVLTLLLVAASQYATRRSAPSAPCRGGSAGAATATPEARGFKRAYLVAYILAMLADWLQGPYVYALYAAYGFTKADNGLLFIFGFGSSMLFGTFIGGYADRCARAHERAPAGACPWCDVCASAHVACKGIYL